MPAPGDLHRLNAASANPYEEAPMRLTEYTAQEIATLQSRLDKQLGPEYVSSRPGAGGSKVHYLAAEKVINLANEVFGFNGWSSQIRNVQIDFCDENPNTGKISIGLSVITRVTLRDGTFHEDIGYGQIENCKGKAAAFEKAKKEGATDAMKRALRTFGNVLGNCLYDKDYLARIAKVKVAPSNWDVENLHRHADFVPVKKEAPVLPEPLKNSELRPTEQKDQSFQFPGIELDDDFGGNLFDEVDLGPARPDEIVLPCESRPATPRPPQLGNSGGPQTLPQNNQNRQVVPTRQVAGGAPPGQIIQATDSRGNSAQNLSLTLATPPNPVVNQGQPAAHSANEQQNSRTHEPPLGFITARSATLLADANPPDTTILNNLPKFNPMADSPSIRKTSGINHNTSGPVLRAAVLNGVINPVPSAMSEASARAGPVNFVNPSENLQRRIGAPSGGMSPMSNRTAYKPPTMAGAKRQLGEQGDAAVSSRPVLADVSNTVGQGGTDAGDYAKKQRVADS